MRVPIQLMANGTGLVTIDLELTPSGFEDALEESRFKQRLNEGRSVGEFGAPDVSALMGNESAVLYRQRCTDDARTCFIFYEGMMYDNRYLQLKMKAFGPMAGQFQRALSQAASETQYVTFRLQHQEIDDESKVTNIYGADYTPTF